MKHTITNYIILLSLMLISASCQSPQPISMETLLKEMTDRDVFTRYPSPMYVCKQFSSYDRATVTPDSISWFANWDRSMFIRVDSLNGRKEYVMMETENPGAIVRFWMTFAGENSGKGILRIYFDNEETARIEGTAFSIISGGKLVGEPLSSSVSDSTKYEMRGHNLYLPLPYSKSCKVTYESENIKDFGAKTGGEAVYYNINYREYNKETNVLTYTNEDLITYKPLIEKTQHLLKERIADIPDNAGKETLTGMIAAGKSIQKEINLANTAIHKLSFRISSDNLPQALRSTILRLSFDDNTTVECPIGDFFGTGYQIRHSNTWYTKVTEDGLLTCYWVMPFKQSFRINIENKGNEPINIQTGDILTAPYQWDNNSMYFGSSWQQFTNLHTGGQKRNNGSGGAFDINYVTLNGKGVYVGDALSLFNTVDAWWGEGDEKVYVDGETFPSHIGTGTEDYYGYAWCRPEIFNHPFISQPDGSGNFNPGYTINMRYRSLDAIPFTQSLKFDMEMWHWVEAVINFSPVTYWYIMPDDVGKNINLSKLQDATLPVALKLEDMVY